MSKLPQISGRECVKALEKASFTFVRQRGSHNIYNDSINMLYLT